MTREKLVYNRFAGRLDSVDGKLIGAALVDDSYDPLGTDTDVDSITGEVTGTGYVRGQFTGEWDAATLTARVAADAWPTFDISATDTPVTGVVFFYDDTGPDADLLISFIPYEEQSPVVGWVLQPLNGFARATPGALLDTRLTAVEAWTVADIPFTGGNVDADALAAALGVGSGGGGGAAGAVLATETAGVADVASLIAAGKAAVTVELTDTLTTINMPTLPTTTTGAEFTLYLSPADVSPGSFDDVSFTVEGGGDADLAGAVDLGDGFHAWLVEAFPRLGGGFGWLLFPLTDGSGGAGGGVAANSPITGDTKTKITYDSKGLVTAGADATAADVGAVPTSDVGVAGGVAELDGAGLVPSAQLPSYVDDVIEAANFAALPGTGASGKIYVTLDNNLTYRWSGSAYVEISASLALGETSGTAYRGDRGKTAYDHSQDVTTNPHNVTKAQVGLSAVTNDAQLKAADLDNDTAFTADSASKVPTQHAVKTGLDTKAPLASPTFTGTPAAPTAAASTATTQIATTAMVAAAIKVTPVNLGSSLSGSVTATLTDSGLWTGMFYGTLAGSVTLVLAGATNGVECEWLFSLTQDGTGSRVITWPTAKWAGGVAPVLSTTASANDQVMFRTRDGGTTVYGFLLGKGMA